MSIGSTEIRRIKRKTNYIPYPYGSKSGVPTVRLKLSTSESNSVEVSSLDRVFEGNGWKPKLNSGFARLRITGSEPLSDLHSSSIESLGTILNPRFVDIEIDEEDLNEEPSRAVQNLTDFYSLFLTTDRKYDDEVLRHFAENSKKFGNAEFIVKVDSWTDEDKIGEISRDFKIYDSDIWLYPGGRKIDSVSDNLEICTNIAKRNTWNVSPRLDVVEGYETEEDE